MFCHIAISENQHSLVFNDVKVQPAISQKYSEFILDYKTYFNKHKQHCTYHEKTSF